MPYDQFNNSASIESLRKNIIDTLNAAYFSGIGAAALEIQKAKAADANELMLIARQWRLL